MDRSDPFAKYHDPDGITRIPTDEYRAFFIETEPGLDLSEAEIEREVADSEGYLYGPEEGWLRRFLSRLFGGGSDG